MLGGVGDELPEDVLQHLGGQAQDEPRGYRPHLHGQPPGPAPLGLEEVLKSWTVHWKLIEGAIVIALVLALPGGARQLLSLALPSRDGRDG